MAVPAHKILIVVRVPYVTLRKVFALVDVGQKMTMDESTEVDSAMVAPVGGAGLVTNYKVPLIPLPIPTRAGRSVHFGKGSAKLVRPQLCS